MRFIPGPAFKLIVPINVPHKEFFIGYTKSEEDMISGYSDGFYMPLGQRIKWLKAQPVPQIIVTPIPSIPQPPVVIPNPLPLDPYGSPPPGVNPYGNLSGYSGPGIVNNTTNNKLGLHRSLGITKMDEIEIKFLHLKPEVKQAVEQAIIERGGLPLVQGQTKVVISKR